MPPAPKVVVAAGDLTPFVTALFEAAGTAPAHAATITDVLLWAALRGVDSHGVMRVPRYVELIAAGDLNPRPAIKVTTEAPAAVVLDADRAAGPVAMTLGMAAAEEALPAIRTKIGIK